MNRNHGLATALTLLAIAGLVPACGAFGTDDAPPAPAAPGPDGGDAPKAKQVEGTPDTSDINETLGVFVAPRGSASGEGSRERPLLSLQAAIDLGKKLGKRVYVCTGIYREALTLADSISVIGGLDCSGPLWKPGAAKSRIQSPSSPAVSAKDIASATRLEGLEIVAPNATEPSASSIGIHAVRSSGLVIASSKISAGNGANGTNGTTGIQLVQQGSINGGNSIPAAKCVRNVTCTKFDPSLPWSAPGASGGTSVCAGAPDHNGLPGGTGGTGGLYTLSSDFVNYRWDVLAGATPGEAKPGTPGTNGTDAPVASSLGSLGEDGFVPITGGAGTDGAPGNGGRGGQGGQQQPDYGLPPPSGVRFGDAYRGTSGDGGGAGGCPGLAGAPGTGGGGSIALALVDSPLVLDGAELLSARGGTAGRGAFGSDPTAGGLPGVGWSADPSFAGRPGGRGGLAGVSTNGVSGPSLGIIHAGPGPKIKGSTKIVPGTGGASIDAQVRTVLGTTKTIPATAAGLSKEVHAL